MAQVLKAFATVKEFRAVGSQSSPMCRTITTAVIHHGEPLHSLCRAAADRLPVAQYRRIRSPALQPRAPERTSHSRYSAEPDKRSIAAAGIAQPKQPRTPRYRKPGRLTWGKPH